MEIELPSGRKIGDSQATFVVAECGSNWSTLEDCLTSISQAKACGADAVKFQAYSYEALYGMAPTWDRGPTRPPEGRLSLEWLPKLADKAKACGIEFMCSAFSPELVDAVDPYVNLHKVASAELTHVRILERLRAIGKPVILSTGASGVEDIAQARMVLGAGVSVVLMYCVAAYPAREINLETIGLLHRTFGTIVGYSDHSTDMGVIPLGAVRAGATVLEKHFTAVPEHQSPDRQHSLEPSQFRRMVDSLRGKTAATLGPTPEEKSMILRHNRRLIATRDIAPGDALQEGKNFGIYRSLKDDTRALSPWLIDRVNGRTAHIAIAAGDGIPPECLG